MTATCIIAAIAVAALTIALSWLPRTDPLAVAARQVELAREAMSREDYEAARYWLAKSETTAARAKLWLGNEQN